MAGRTVAKHAGFTSWREFKNSVTEGDIFCPPDSRAYWNTWYASYDEARQHLQNSSDVFLLPYQQQYFICDIHYIERLGLAPDDADLPKVGPDWTKPEDAKAYERIVKKINDAAARKK